MKYDIFHKYGFDSIDDNTSLNESYIPDDWKMIDVKRVTDSDGFLTDYAWYTNGNKHIFMFGDTDFTEPNEDYADWEEDSEDAARDWFDNYHGFEEEEDDDIDFFESKSCSDCTLNEAYNNLPKWFTDYLDSKDGIAVKRRLNSMGIDLANATYVKGAFPRSNRDPVLKDSTRLTIFRLNDGWGSEKVFIKDVNSPYVRVPGSRSWDGKYANELPMKTILELAYEYGYIDTNDTRNSNKEIRKERALLKQHPQRGKGQHPVERTLYATDEYGNRDWKNPIGTEIEWVMTKGEDKSGYSIDPEKYVKMLDNVGLDTYGDRLESYYKKIESVRSRLIALMGKFDIKEANKFRTYGSFSNNVFSDIAQAMDSFGRSISSYQTLKQRCEELVNRHKDDIENDKINERIATCFKWDGKYVRDYLKDAIDLITKIEKTEKLSDQE